MTHAYVIGHIKIIEPAKWQVYRDQVPATLEPWSTELVFRGKIFEIFSGDHDHTDTVVIRFPDSQAVKNWHNSEQYKSLIPLRQAAADVTLLAYEE